MASLEQILAQRDVVNGAIDAWKLAEEQASQDATAAASAGAVAQTSQEAANASAALADQKRTEAQVEAQALSDMLNEAPTGRRGKKP
jgi:hypothetical protein